MDDFASSTNGTNGPYAPSLEANSHGGSRPTHSQSGPAHLGVAPESQPSAYDGPDDEYPTAPHLSSKTSGMSEDRTRYPRISLPVELMRDSYDVVVIGTGYGGSVAASRMARGRQSVCVLERGKERWPGEFPEALHTAAGEIRVSGEFAPGDRRGWPGSLIRGGNPTGLYHFAAGDGQNVYMANGLGGTSLVNANVFMEATPAVLDMSIWPEELRGSDAWRQYYDRAGDVLEPVEYPDTFPNLAKMKLLKKQATLLGHGDKFRKVKQTTRFLDGPNSTGVSMRASTLSGMDATGLNDGSKSSTLVNYLSDAWNWGAEMFCECEVRYITKAPGRDGYIVYFAWHGGKRGQFNSFYDDLMWVHSKKLVFLGAGSLGSTEILLRSKQFGLPMSDDVGTEMSGNGDMLGFGYNTDYEANCVARRYGSLESPVGPCISSVLDMRDGENPMEGFVVEDAAIPYALRHLLVPILEYLPDPIQPIYGLMRTLSKWASRVRSEFFGPYYPGGSIARTAVYLVMSHDSSQGRLSLKDDRPVLTYSGVGRSASVSLIHGFLERLTAVVGGNFIANPMWTVLGDQQISVHPIGGARLSSNGTGSAGVVNHVGEVFKGSGAETHSGLIVCDGSVIPAALGVNPFATITAFSERAVELVAKEHRISIDYDTRNGHLDMFGKPAFPMNGTPRSIELTQKIEMAVQRGSAGIGFSEIMAGFIHSGPDVGDFRASTELARRNCETARFFLTARSWDTQELVHSTLHQANLTGTFTSSSLGGSFIVHQGTFQLFSRDPREPETTNLVYKFVMTSPSGRKLQFQGYKVVNAGSFLNPLEIWRQTGTLYVTITETGKGIVGRGTMYLCVPDFLQQMQTFTVDGPTAFAQVGSLARFFGYFTQQLKVPFLSTLGRLQTSGENVNHSFQLMAPSQTIPVEATDGVRTTMLMWNPLVSGAESLSAAATILFIPGAAVDHGIFATPTVEKNAVTYFRELGYRTYCLTHRVGRTPVAKHGHTPFDARLDISAALARIQKIETARSPEDYKGAYIIAHCAGSLSLACGLLDGTITAEGVRGITASMVFMNPRFGKVNHVLSQLPTSVYERLIGGWWDCVGSQEDSLLHKAVAQLLRLYPVGSARETCRSDVCHRSELVFGRLWTHENLNDETHRRLDRLLGGTTWDSLRWLITTGHAGNVAGNLPSTTNLVTPENIERLKGIPILFLSGSQNKVFAPENTDTSYTTLCNAHGRRWYQREVLSGRGHLDAWIGATAHMDVYPRVLQHIREAEAWEH